MFDKQRLPKWDSPKFEVQTFKDDERKLKGFQKVFLTENSVDITWCI